MHYPLTPCPRSPEGAGKELAGAAGATRQPHPQPNHPLPVRRRGGRGRGSAKRYVTSFSIHQEVAWWWGRAPTATPPPINPKAREDRLTACPRRARIALPLIQPREAEKERKDAFDDQARRATRRINITRSPPSPLRRWRGFLLSIVGSLQSRPCDSGGMGEAGYLLGASPEIPFIWPQSATHVTDCGQENRILESLRSSKPPAEHATA